jgi:hypothetical protein
MENKLIWDLLPEKFPYEDKGCELFPSCLNCPFPECLKEEPWGKERFLKSKRAGRMLELKQGGKSIKEIARIFEVSPITVRRWLKAVDGRESKEGTDKDGDCHAPFRCSQ